MAVPVTDNLTMTNFLYYPAPAPPPPPPLPPPPRQLLLEIKL